MLPNTATDNLKFKDDYSMENKDQKFDKKEYNKQHRNENFKQIAYRYRCTNCGTPTKLKVAVCIVDIAVLRIILERCSCYLCKVKRDNKQLQIRHNIRPKADDRF